MHLPVGPKDQPWALWTWHATINLPEHPLTVGMGGMGTGDSTSAVAAAIVDDVPAMREIVAAAIARAEAHAADRSSSGGDADAAPSFLPEDLAELAAAAQHAVSVPLLALLPEEALFAADDVHGVTPLLHATAAGHIDVVRYLVSRGANIRASSSDVQLKDVKGGRVRNKHGQGLIHAAARSGSVDTVRFLVEAGANVREKTARQLFAERFFRLNALHCTELRLGFSFPAECSAVS